jgi:hypothetical protein
MTLIRPTQIHYTELPRSQPGREWVEWETYRREVGRLLAEGLEGKSVLIKNETIIGIYDSMDEARDEGYRRYLLNGFLIHQIKTWEKVHSGRNHC